MLSLASLAHLGRRERAVTQIATELHMTQPNATRHIEILLDARLIVPRREGRLTYYYAPESALREHFERAARATSRRSPSGSASGFSHQPRCGGLRSTRYALVQRRLQPRAGRNHGWLGWRRGIPDEALERGYDGRSLLVGGARHNDRRLRAPVDHAARVSCSRHGFRSRPAPSRRTERGLARRGDRPPQVDPGRRRSLCSIRPPLNFCAFRR
jgi:DNA-binding transcriptional ArsR family regulator